MCTPRWPGELEIMHAKASSLHVLGEHAAAVRYMCSLSLTSSHDTMPCHALTFYHLLYSPPSLTLTPPDAPMRLYDELLSSPVQPNEQTTYRERTFFQRHLLAYTVSRLDQPFSAFRIDDDLDEEWRVRKWVGEERGAGRGRGARVPSLRSPIGLIAFPSHRAHYSALHNHASERASPCNIILSSSPLLSSLLLPSPLLSSPHLASPLLPSPPLSSRPLSSCPLSSRPLSSRPLPSHLLPLLPFLPPMPRVTGQLQAATWKHLPRLSGAALQLVEAADVIGARTHYDTDGMLLNTQQLRMAGLAALDVTHKLRMAGLASLDVMQQVRRTLLLIADQMRIAPLLFGTDGPDGPDEQWQQQLEQALQERQGGQRTGRSRQSSSGGGRSPLDRSDLMTSWRHVFRVLVAWRQVSDAMEPIAWKAFAKGQRWPADMLYRTDTPIFTWVMGTARYLAVYPNFPPAGSSTAAPLFLAPLLPFFPPSPSCTGQWISHGMAGPIAVSQRALDAEGDEHRAPGPAAVTDGVSSQVNITRRGLLQAERAFDADTHQPFDVPRSTFGAQLEAAEDHEGLFNVIGRDFYVRLPCYSRAFPGLVRLPCYSTPHHAQDAFMLSCAPFLLPPLTSSVCCMHLFWLSILIVIDCPSPPTLLCRKDMGGTEFRLRKRPLAVDFDTFTTVDATRWNAFDSELTAAWQGFMEAALDHRTKATSPHVYRQHIQDQIIAIAYYWFQLMPLSRGSAMVGLMSIISLSMAADMETTSHVPRDILVSAVSSVSGAAGATIWKPLRMSLGTAW
ncbi:unnamed protein product [Closterium sp. Naga37s-1]|nr:unnamed protein product [Closterium sp. Naga37s-1]